MTEPRIKSVSLESQMSPIGDVVFYEVGKCGVTKITKESRKRVPNFYYVIWNGNVRIAELHHYSLVRYFCPENDMLVPENDSLLHYIITACKG